MNFSLAKAGVCIAAVCLAPLASAQLPRGFLRGGDVSEISQVESTGGKYYLDGKQADPFVLLKKAGWNFVRFRVWNQPKDGFCDKAHTLELARRAKAQGFKISIDFHYSDWWADPGKQFKPAAWKDLPLDQLAAAVHDYTKDVISALTKQGTPPYMVQVGNEITSGMLWPDGKLNSEDPGQWKNLATLVQAGLQGVRDADGGKKVLTMIHLDRGADNKGAVWWFDHIAKENVSFDTIGLSYYPFWHGHLDQLKANLDDLANRYHKDVYVVETAYPWTTDGAHGGRRIYADASKVEGGYAESPDGQAGFLANVEKIILEVPHGRGKGILYWAPTWIAAPGRQGGWSNLTMFDFDGNALPGVKVLGGAK
jgi:arabinogalactan endo-1,4-beta-galactosidase